ncbi:hypothetical protein E2C01_030697 [Portunus trituberculatus]|uniref:Uncharacterized protein n=1 Tax=Portunus trituberculatus TaxID=210409 RepID=A0A5B7ESM5_PORTR|nr:hypothetical protein [Portunus trituberculatus]
MKATLDSLAQHLSGRHAAAECFVVLLWFFDTHPHGTAVYNGSDGSNGILNTIEDLENTLGNLTNQLCGL